MKELILKANINCAIVCKGIGRHLRGPLPPKELMMWPCELQYQSTKYTTVKINNNW